MGSVTRINIFSVFDRRVGMNGYLWAVATSVFPTVGGTSPSLGLMQLALRAADDIVSSIAESAKETLKASIFRGAR